MAYTYMKIGAEDASDYSDANNFTFQVNPTIVDSGMVTQRQIKELPHQKIHMLIDQGGLKPRTFMLKGHLHGTDKITNLNTLANHIFETGMKRFYYANDRFFYCFGGDLKHTFQGGRTNFVDFVAALITPLPFAYDDTNAYESWTIANATATTINSSNDSGASEGAFKNDGSAPSHIQTWTITNVGAANITKVELGDAAVSGSAVQGNKITWEGTLAQNEVLKIYLFKVVSTEGIRMFKKLYYTVDDAFSGDRDFDGDEPPHITAGEANQSFSVKLTGNNGSSTVRADWRDAYWV